MPSSPASPAPAPGGLLNSRQAAAWLGISERSLQRIRDGGDLPYLRLNSRSIRYRTESLERWAVAQEQRVENPATQGE